jgi:DNA-binding GntR family transcriptional regulator
MDALPPQSGTQAARLFEAIEHALITGEYAPGTRLGEKTLSRRFGVSRGPLREALRHLEGRGLVVRLPHAGVRVVSLGETDLDELYEIRQSLEATACRLAAQRITADEVAGLRALLARHRTSEAFREGRHYGNLDIHYLIVKAARSSRLERFLCTDLYSLIRLCRFANADAPGKPERAHQEHERIVDAIEDRDAELAELLMRRHIAASRNDFRRVGAPAPFGR